MSAADARQELAPGEWLRFTPEGPHAALIRSADYLPFQPPSGVRVLHTQAEFPGSAVQVEGQIYEVVTETLQVDGTVEYRLDPWREKFILRRVFHWGPEFLRRVLVARERAAFRERWHGAGLLLSPFIGLLPEVPQEQLCSRFGINALLATRLSCLFEILVYVVAGLQVASSWVAPTSSPEVFLGPDGEMTGKAIYYANPLGLFLIPLALLTIAPALLRSAGAFLFGEVSGSAWVEMFWSLGSGAVRSAGKGMETALLTRPMFWQALERGDTVSTLPEGGFLVESAIPHPAWLDGAGARTGAGAWMVSALEPWGLPDPPVFPFLLTARRGEHLLAKDPGPPPARAYAEEMAERVRRHWDFLFGSFPGLVPALSPPAQARALRVLGRAQFPSSWVWRSLLAPLVLAAVMAAAARKVPDTPALILTWLVLMLLVEALLRAGLLVAGRLAPSLAGVLLTDLLPPERAPFVQHREAWQDCVEAMRERGARG